MECYVEFSLLLCCLSVLRGKTQIATNCQGNKLLLLPENMFTSWTMLTEINAGMQTKYYRIYIILLSFSFPETNI
jgi:hypothetical protein